MRELGNLDIGAWAKKKHVVSTREKIQWSTFNVNAIEKLHSNHYAECEKEQKENENKKKNMNESNI